MRITKEMCFKRDDPEELVNNNHFKNTFYYISFKVLFYFFLSYADSESEETVQVKNAKKQPEKLPLSKPDKILRQDPVTYISETGKDTGCV